MQPALRSLCRSLPVSLVASLLLLLASTRVMAGPPSPPHTAPPPPAPSAVPRANNPTGLVRKVLPLRYVDCRTIVSLINDSLSDLSNPADTVHQPADLDGAAGRDHNGSPVPASRPTTVMDLLPAGSLLVPYQPSNFLIVVTSPDGLDLITRLIRPLDVRPLFVLVQLELVKTRLAALQAAGFSPALSTPLGKVPATSGTAPPTSIQFSYLGRDTGGQREALEQNPATRVTSRPRVILPSGVLGMISSSIQASTPSSAPEQGAATTPASGTRTSQLSLGLTPRLNRDGTITVHGWIEEIDLPGQPSAVPLAGDNPVKLTLPGIRIPNGDTIALLAHTGSDAAETDSPDREVMAYFFTPNLIDEHGQVVPGGAEAVRKAMADAYIPVATSPVPAAPEAPLPVGHVREVIALHYLRCQQIMPLLGPGLERLSDPMDLIAGRTQNDKWDAAGGTGKSTTTTILDMLPADTRVVPDQASNSLIVVTSPPGLELLKQFVRLLDIRPHVVVIKLEKLVTRNSALKSAGLAVNLVSSSTNHPESGNNTPPATISIFYLGNALARNLQLLERDPHTRVVQRPHFMVTDGAGSLVLGSNQPLPSFVNGSSGSKSSQQPFSASVIPRLNRDGTITLYVLIKDSIIPISQGATPAVACPISIPLPGIRVVNGDTIAVAGAECPAPGAASTNGGKSGDRQVVMYFVTPNLVDRHNQVVPGGAEAVRKAMEQQDAE